MTETPSPSSPRAREVLWTGRDTRGFDLAQMALSVHEEATVPETVDRVLDFARAAVDCGHAAVVFVHARRRLEIVASTDPAIAALIEKQVEVHAGPILSMVNGCDCVLVTDTETDARWPAWASTAAAVGFRSMMGVRLYASERTMGTLNMYDARPHQFSDADVQTAHVLARHAAIALSRVQDSENFSRAIDSRKLIGQAQGILMERYALDQDRAFEVLRRYSQDSNVKLRDVAQMIVDTRRRSHPCT
ncbi:GAF and ANTAR domain-containing protein [Nocardioides panacis]|uniref:GAF and ANTAR domain-containing protein n=1 Tax=Nocardioides panacis TaxID=2849501 RepID=A0A975T1R4_9ACTN|nr:GAF and ANTAR domain-containing protein [Nocardioides panacis]QWZ10048.1 GAF and ANTAR domain-containing protein [Nocardioides panacis]